jgi:hypothetical protein
MPFYEFGDNSPYEKNWVVAARIHPKSHLVKWICPECGRAAQYPAGSFDVTVERGSEFPDILGCGACPLLILSERVVTALKGAGVSCFHSSPVGIAAIQESRALLQDAPDYFRLEISGECMIDIAGSGATIKRICGRCGEISVDPPVTREFKIIEGSWDGCVLFHDRRYFPRVPFCTQKLIDLATANGFTNFTFRKMR